MHYELALEAYHGPLEKLLELIEERKMEITEISLAAITDDFLKYLEELHRKDEALFRSPEGLRFLADFIVVASRLVFIKSKSLLPSVPVSEEEETGIQDLELRLRLHKKLKEIARGLDELWRSDGREFGRPYFLTFHKATGVFYPGEGLTPDALRSSLQNIVFLLEEYKRETETIRNAVVSLEEKIKEVLAYLHANGGATLGVMAAAQSRA